MLTVANFTVITGDVALDGWGGLRGAFYLTSLRRACLGLRLVDCSGSHVLARHPFNTI